MPETITAREAAQIERANHQTAKQPVLFVHGLWLLASSWHPWVNLFESEGYVSLTSDWPGDPATVDEGRKDPQRFAGKSVADIVEHLVRVVQRLKRPPVIIGHSFGGMFTQMLAGRGLAKASIAIDPAPFRGVLALPLSAIKAASPALANPLNVERSVMLTRAQFRYAFANAVGETESDSLYERYAVPGAAKPLFQAASANLNPWSEVQVDTRNHKRGPLLIISGERDNTVPWAVANGAFKLQQRNPGITEIMEMPGRGHSLVIDSGWREVADIALSFAARFSDQPASGVSVGKSTTP